MTRPAGWRRIFRLSHRNIAREVDAELRFHFDQKISDLKARGMDDDAARAQADAEFGDIGAVRATLVTIDDRIADHAQCAEWWEQVAQDLRQAFRSMRRAPAFTTMVALTLALGLGANVAIFAVLERLFWRQPGGVVAPSEVRRIHQVASSTAPKQHRPNSVFAYVQLRAMSRVMPAGTALAGFRTARAPLGRDATARQGVATSIIGDYFGVLGVVPAAGRFFSADEARAETFSPVAVISYRMWIEQYGGASSAIGQPLDLGSRRYTVIGVAPAAFHGINLDASDVWIPMSTQGTWKNRNPKWYEGRGTLSIHPIVRVTTPAQALAVEAAATRGLRSERFGDSTDVGALSSVIEPVWPDDGAAQLTTATRLAGVALIILLIACANVANLLLARGMQRRREIAIRLALGVRRRRLVGQLLVESVALAGVAGAAALVFGAWGASALRHALLPNVVWGDSTFGLPLVAFAIAAALVTGFVAGLAPALQASRPDLIPALKGGARDGLRRSRLRTGFVVAQAALSVVLLASAGLFVRSLRNVEATDIGFDSSRLLFATVSFDGEGDDHWNDITTRMPDVADRIARVPGVEHVGLAAGTPFQVISFVGALYLPHGDSLPLPLPTVSYVSPDFFETSGIRVLQGRAFGPQDRAGAPLVLVVDQAMARAVWPGQSAVGRCLIIDTVSAPCREIVGVVSNAHEYAIIERPSMHFYVPLAQPVSDQQPSTLVIRAVAGRTRAITPVVRDAVAAEFGGWARPTVTAFSDILAPQLKPWRLSAMLFSAAGLLALLVAAVGVYSSVAYAISQRMHEMGVRVALGARTTHIVKLVVGEGVRAVLAGVAIGTILALVLGRMVASLLYNTSARDPGVLGSVSVTLLVVAVVACLVPAWRATRADPVATLRAD